MPGLRVGGGVTASWTVLRIDGERRAFMSPLRLQNPPPNSSWWRRYWDSFKSNFPNRSGEQARSLAFVLLAFVSLFLLARIFFAYFGLPD
jgi:hypothetical protein